MTKIRNVSPSGDLEVPEFGGTIKAGEVADVPSALAVRLLEQDVNWAPVKETKE